MQRTPRERRGWQSVVTGAGSLIRIVMLTPTQFVESWHRFVTALEPDSIRQDHRLVTCPPHSPALTLLPPHSVVFLVEAGLPWSCAPFLSFKDVGQGIPSLVEHFALASEPQIHRHSLRQYFVVGCDASGSPLCVDTTEAGRVYMLDHDDAFRSRHLVASSIPQLAEGLLLVYTVPHEEFQDRFAEIDPEAARDGFLPAEVEQLMDA